jgi:hypothetical protein
MVFRYVELFLQHWTDFKMWFCWSAPLNLKEPTMTKIAKVMTSSLAVQTDEGFLTMGTREKKRAGVPWQPVNLARLPAGSFEEMQALDETYNDYLLATVEAEAERLSNSFDARLKTLIEKIRAELPTRAGKFLSLRYVPRQLQYYYRDENQTRTRQFRPRDVLGRS